MNKQQSISEIAPETQRTMNQGMIRKGSMENLYGFVMGGETEEALSARQSARTFYEEGANTYTR